MIAELKHRSARATTLKVAIVGFGNVGRAVAASIGSTWHCDGCDVVIVGIYDPKFGAVYDRQGIDGAALAERSGSAGAVGETQVADASDALRSWDWDVLVEATPTNLTDAEPARSLILEALRSGRSVVTSNKGPAALNWDEITATAETAGATFGYEATVMSGTPVVALVERLRAAGIIRLEAILNGTSNFILDQLDAGVPFVEAVAAAQLQGIAEADPSGDVDGHDAAAKLAILSQLAFQRPLALGTIPRASIGGHSPADAARARSAGERLRVVSRLTRSGDEIQAEMAVESLPASDPFANVTGTTTAVRVTTELLGEVVIQGAGSGRSETAAGILQDIATITRKSAR